MAPPPWLVDDVALNLGPPRNIATLMADKCGRAGAASVALWLAMPLLVCAVQANEFTRLAADGTKLDGRADATHAWTCSRDELSGLTWELKTRDGTARDRRWTYTPYDGNPATNGGYPGYRDKTSGQCIRAAMPGNSCNTEAYVELVNAAHLCGHADWRLPTAAELTAVAPTTSLESPAADSAMLPNTSEGWYWTGVTRVGIAAFARVVLLPPAGQPAFYDGSYMVILVRGP